MIYIGILLLIFLLIKILAKSIIFVAKKIYKLIQKYWFQLLIIVLSLISIILLFTHPIFCLIVIGIILIFSGRRFVG